MGGCTGENGYFTDASSWKSQAEALFFREHLSAANIAKIVHKSREAVSRHLSSCADYGDEIGRRREWSRERRAEYKKRWIRDYRAGVNSEIDADDLRACHDEAARVLSRERFFDEW
jgi:predicted transcriptional regulator